MDIEVRALRDEDREGYYDVRSLTYNNGTPIPEDRRVFKHTRPFVAEQDGQIKGVYGILDLTCTRGEAVLKCGGVAGVGVMPHERRSGVGKAMMRSCVRSLRDEGIPMASLYAFREPYYRMFGYEVAGKRLKITCPMERMPKVPSELPLRRLKPAEWLELDPCYRSFCHARSGMSLRDEKLWKRVLAENRELTIYAAGDPVEAYVVISHSVGFWETDHVSEFVWSTPRGYMSLFDVLRSIGINKKALSWFEPSDGPFYQAHLDEGVDVSLARPIMYRVCDVPVALSLLRPHGEGRFSICVKDELVPENEGPWLVTFGGGQVAVSRSESFEIEMDSQRFAQAFLGEPSIETLARNGFVSVSSASALAEAAKLMPASSTYCLDFF
jgi:predicted acetyltransferase